MINKHYSQLTHSLTHSHCLPPHLHNKTTTKQPQARAQGHLENFNAQLTVLRRERLLISADLAACEVLKEKKHEERIVGGWYTE
jgi:hypothetical protein